MKINVELAGWQLDGRVQLRATIPLTFNMVIEFDRGFKWASYGPTLDGLGCRITSPYFRTAREGMGWIETVRRLAAKAESASKVVEAEWQPLLGSHEVAKGS